MDWSLLLSIIALLTSGIACMVVSTKKSPSRECIRREERCLTEEQIANEIKKREEYENYINHSARLVYQFALDQAYKDFEKAQKGYANASRKNS